MPPRFTRRPKALLGKLRKHFPRGRAAPGKTSPTPEQNPLIPRLGGRLRQPASCPECGITLPQKKPKRCFSCGEGL